MTLATSEARAQNLPAPLPPPAAAFHRAVDLVADHVGIRRDAVVRPRRHVERRARHLALYLTVVACGFGMREVARAVGCPHPSVRWGFGRIEDQRDDPVVDSQLTELEEAMAS